MLKKLPNQRIKFLMKIYLKRCLYLLKKRLRLESGRYGGPISFESHYISSYIFSQRNQKDEEEKYHKFILMVKQLSLNISLVEELEKILGYAKFTIDLVKEKRIISFELVNNLHHCSAIASRSIVQKKEDPEAFII